MKPSLLPLSLLILAVVACGSIGIEGQLFQPTEATATALARHAALTSTSDAATAAIEHEVGLTLTAALSTPTNTPAPTSTPEPTTAVPPTDTPAPTATSRPAPRPTFTPAGSDPFVGTWIAVDIYDGSNQVLTITRNDGGYTLVLVDDGASVCGKDEAGKPKFGIEIWAVGTAQGNVLTSTSTSATCLSDPPSSAVQILAISHTYQASADILIDTWMNAGAVFNGPIWRRR